jgi:murein L,D-transpeptidase YcbB/YkuD
MEYATGATHLPAMGPVALMYRVVAAALLGASLVQSASPQSASPRSASPQSASPQSATPPRLGLPATTIEAVVRSFDPSAADAHDRPLLHAVSRFYTDRRFTPAWTDARGLTVAGVRLTEALAVANDEGLDARAYDVQTPDPRDTAARARADVRLSFLALRFAEDLGVGLAVPGAIHRDHAFVRPRLRGDSLLHALRNAADAKRALLGTAPATPGYVRLREALQQLRAIEQRGGWDTLPAGPTLRLGMSGARVAQLRQLLRQRGDLEGGHSGDGTATYDEALAVAVARFQERHGLTVDSLAGRATAAALNVPVRDRLEQVRLGMERTRWLPAVTGNRWITVNLADYMAFVFDDGQPVFATRVVIGDRNHKTPMFVDTLTTIVLNPAWNVPPSIAAKEILPKLRREPDYLEQNHMIRVGRDIQQVPGPWNALGQIAFMLPNRFNVYLHDTPAKALFALPDRAHSHGCIRVQRPHELATLLLEADGWTRARLDSVIATGRRTAVLLKTPVPVRITYATAFADRDGTLQLRPDVYRRDALLARALVLEHQRPLPAPLR